MVQEVRDTTANENDTIAMAARTIGGGARRDVFNAIYHGKKRVKSAADIAATTGLSQKRVTECGKVLAQRGIVRQLEEFPVSYEKVGSYIPLRPRTAGFDANCSVALMASNMYADKTRVPAESGSR
jgi:hypothetical protein